MILRDIKTVIGLNLKLMLKSRAAVIILLIMSVIFLLLLKSFSAEINVKSNIPIGMADEDGTELSKEFLENCKKQEGIYVYDAERKNLEEKLYKNEIAGYFIIKQGFQESVRKGQTKNLIASYAYENASFTSVVSDILAGEIMYELCLSNTWNMYAGLDSSMSKYNQEQFYNYIDRLKEDTRYKYAFDIHMVEKDKKEPKKTEFQYQLIYEQIVLAIISMALCIIAMFLVWSIMENPDSQVLKRRRLLFIPNIVFYLGELLSVGSVMSLYTICCSLIMYLMGHSLNIVDFVSIMFTGIAFSMGVVIAFYVIRKIIKSNTAYQLISFLFIIVTSVISMLGIFSVEMKKMTMFIPNDWFVQGITDIIIR